MSSGTRATNALLDDMSRKDYRRLSPHLIRVELNLAEVLVQQGASRKFVYFPASGLIAVHTTVVNRLSVELIGNEGVVGASVAAGIRAPPALIVVQGQGAAMQMDARRFRLIADDSASLQRQLHRYTYRLLQYASQMSTCKEFQTLEGRLARCLLDASAKAHSDELHLTQDLLAYMIGAQRTGVSVAATSLRRRKLIAYARGRLSIVDRVGLRRVAWPSRDGGFETRR